MKQNLCFRGKYGFKQGHWQLAIEGSNTVLKEKMRNPEAQLLKAEALFNTCLFEQAFIYFHRGHRLWPFDPRFQSGLSSCQRVILNTTSRDVYNFKELPEFLEDVTKHMESGHILDVYQVRNMLSIWLQYNSGSG